MMGKPKGAKTTDILRKEEKRGKLTQCVENQEP